jgi:hypothetical protein
MLTRKLKMTEKIKYGVSLMFRDGVHHRIEASSLEHAQKYIDDLFEKSSQLIGFFPMYNDEKKLVFICNMNMLMHAMIVEITEKK